MIERKCENLFLPSNNMLTLGVNSLELNTCITCREADSLHFFKEKILISCLHEKRDDFMRKTYKYEARRSRFFIIFETGRMLSSKREKKKFDEQ